MTRTSNIERPGLYVGDLSMAKIWVVLMLVVSAVSLPACNTVQGAGKDIEKAGAAIEKAAK